MSTRFVRALHRTLEESVWVTAVHESGHAVAALATGGWVREMVIPSVEEVLKTGARGHCGSHSMTEWAKLVTDLGGIAAEVAFHVGRGEGSKDWGIKVLREGLEGVIDPDFAEERDPDIMKAVGKAAGCLVLRADLHPESLCGPESHLALMVPEIGKKPVDTARLIDESARLCMDVFPLIVRYMLRNRSAVAGLARRLVKRRRIESRWPTVPQMRWRPLPSNRVVRAVTGFRTAEAWSRALMRD